MGSLGRARLRLADALAAGGDRGRRLARTRQASAEMLRPPRQALMTSNRKAEGGKSAETVDESVTGSVNPFEEESLETLAEGRLP
jgi:hypothetical protein